MEEKFQKIKERVEKELSACPGHNIEHVNRVYNLCLYLAKNKNVDLEVIQVAALLHDIGGVKEMMDSSGKTCHACVSAEMAYPILKEVGFSEDKIKHIQDCILSHRYKTDNEPKTEEAKILFDADKLDSLGAVGIARSFIWVCRNNAHIYRKVNIEKHIKENLVGGKISGRIKIKSEHSPQIEFETKTKFLLDRLYTDEAKRIGRERLDYYKSFLDRLEKEVKGDI